MRIPYTLSDYSATVFADGKVLTIMSGNKNFERLAHLLKETEHDVPAIVKLMDREDGIRQSTSGTDIEVIHGTVYYKGEEVRNALTEKLLDLMDAGYDAGPWVKFLKNLMLNPSYRSRECLYNFLEQFDAPITPEGNFIAFKRISKNWKDIHSGKFDNSIGTVVQMDRAKVDDDPQHTCSSGLHICADKYLQHFADAEHSRTVVVEVIPAHVVAVPYDYDFAKMRVCEYKVLAEIEPSEIPDILEESMYYDEDCCGEGCCDEHYPDIDEGAVRF
jgi:hypothetical protein